MNVSKDEWRARNLNTASTKHMHDQMSKACQDLQDDARIRAVPEDTVTNAKPRSRTGMHAHNLWIQDVSGNSDTLKIKECVEIHDPLSYTVKVNQRPSKERASCTGTTYEDMRLMGIIQKNKDTGDTGQQTHARLRSNSHWYSAIILLQTYTIMILLSRGRQEHEPFPACIISTTKSYQDTSISTATLPQATYVVSKICFTFKMRK
ncbi:hypothetical protein BJ508DRAFT_314905 [Ascobolus immersus RN42]|uniref:Uncharacterized protein n=1 Tax=Ascobolus immersus RN42 TaxID=1160509 RepID=A0A3N4HHL0_ASCIM|nr:hypothetical protein BJ508DRAFT_314905 [Ascobolus immersus RN42]